MCQIINLNLTASKKSTLLSRESFFCCTYTALPFYLIEPNNGLECGPYTDSGFNNKSAQYWGKGAPTDRPHHETPPFSAPFHTLFTFIFYPTTSTQHRVLKRIFDHEQKGPIYPQSSSSGVKRGGHWYKRFLLAPFETLAQ